MERTPTKERLGLIDSASAAASTMVTMVRTRLDLLSTDLEEEKQHIVSLTLFVLGAIFCLEVGVVLLVTLLVLAFWDSHRALALGTLAGMFLASGVLAIVMALRRIREKPRLFHASLAELSKDREWLAPRL